MNLVAHRATLESVVTEQQSAVRKLEGKLSETEGLLRNVINASSKQQSASDKGTGIAHGFNIQQKQTNAHHAHSSSEEVYSSGVDKRRRPVSADSRKRHSLSPDTPQHKRYEDKSSRHRHRGGWMSDNDEHISDSDTSPSSESVLRRVIADLLSKDYPSRKSSHRSKVLITT